MWQGTNWNVKIILGQSGEVCNDIIGLIFLNPKTSQERKKRGRDREKNEKPVKAFNG